MAQKTPRLIRQHVAINGVSLLVVRLRPSVSTTGTIFVPPLIGGGAQMQLRYFRTLNKFGYEIVSFQYRGHGLSEGRFCINSAIDDTIALAKHIAVQEPVDQFALYGIADCFGAIPLLSAAQESPSRFRALGLANPISCLRQLLSPLQAWQHHLKQTTIRNARQIFSPRAILCSVNELLFPDIDHSSEHFGILNFSRARAFDSFKSYFLDDPLRGTNVCTPTHIVYGAEDVLLGTKTIESRQQYEARFKHHLRHVSFSQIETAGHFFEGTYRDVSLRMNRFFDRQNLPNHP